MKQNISEFFPSLRVVRLMMLTLAFLCGMHSVWGYSLPRQSTSENKRQHTIVVWRVGSPHDGDVPEGTIPADLQAEAKKLGCDIEIKSFSAKGFANLFFDAVFTNEEPDILIIDNYGIIKGVQTKTGYITGIKPNKKVASSLVEVPESLRSFKSPRGGWEFLISSSRNHNAAKALVMRKPESGASLSGNMHRFTPDELPLIEEIATSACRAYLTCDTVSMSKISDESRLETGCRFPTKDSKVEHIRVSDVFGNQELAFVFMVSSFRAKERISSSLESSDPSSNISDVLGHKSILAVLRKKEATWKLLTITDDPVSNTTSTLGPFMRQLSSLMVSADGLANPPMPANLITDDWVNISYKQGAGFMDFIWHPSQSSDVICEVAEFEYQNATRLFFLFEDYGKVSSGKLWTTGGVWQWRIWSISKNGKMALSEHRSFKY